MYALMAICTTLSPGPSDESVMSTVREHYGDQLAALRGDDAVTTFKELFLGACPKYLSVNPPPYEEPSLLEDYVVHDPTQRHLDLFLSDVAAVRGVVASRTLLKLYTSIDAAKLAAFSEADEEGVLEQLMVLKAASRTYARDKSESLLGGERISTNNLDFTIEGVGLNMGRADYSPWCTSKRQHRTESTPGRLFEARSTRRGCLILFEWLRCRSREKCRLQSRRTSRHGRGRSR